MRDAAVEALAARVRALEDAEAIRNLKARYAELVDARYQRGAPRPQPELDRLAGEIAALFSEDAVWEGGALGTCTGRAAIRERMAKPTLRFSRHYFVNPRIRVDGDVATARWELLAPCTAQDDRPMWMAGVEDDAYARVGGSWLHTRMQLGVHFFAPHERGWALRS
ncbi:MAG: nuclear transport factor 2 family protein [Proteobacteria bacterium]|nr:MAG: nuclear transport factor 2 family protein [Pseudomonadota bacterium]